MTRQRMQLAASCLALITLGLVSAMPAALAADPKAVVPTGKSAKVQPQAPSTARSAADAAPDRCVAEILARRNAKPVTDAAASDVGKDRVVSDEDQAYIAYDQGHYQTALSLAEYAAGRGSPQGHTLVARIHDEGDGVPKDPITAARWYARAAELCDVPAMFAYGLMLAEGRGVGKDRVAAADMLEKAAISGHALANYNLGLIFLRGDGKPENPYRAAQHIRYAAEKGIAAAQYDIASLYQAGVGVPQNLVEASHWFNRAAAAGFTAAQYDYAVMLLKGLGLEADKPKAITYLKAAADKSIPGAQNRLANLYFEGSGVDKNLQEAAKWRFLAKKSGVVDDELDTALGQMSKADVAVAEKAASDWEEIHTVAGSGLLPPGKAALPASAAAPVSKPSKK